MIEHEKAKLAAQRGEVLGDGSELFEDWNPPQHRAAQIAFLLMERSEWQVLPGDGGWLDQDEGLMEDISQLARMSMYVRAQLEVNNAEGNRDHY